MADQTPQPPPPSPTPAPAPHAGHGGARPPLLQRIVVELIKRSYALGVIVLVGWLSYGALKYLVVTLLIPSPVPEQIVGVPMRLDQSLLESRRTDWLGVEINENPRTPPAHYHRIVGWLQPDQFNDCARSGCHVQLPHSRDKALRAFLNMHATSLHCGVCHLKSDNHPINAVWYDLRDGTRRGPPTVLQIYTELTAPADKAKFEKPTSELQDQLVRQLRNAASEADNDPMLTRFAEQLAAVRYSSNEFQQLLTQLREMLPRRFRGEYDAKLALQAPDGGPLLGTPNNEQAERAWLERGASASPDERAKLLAAVHPMRRDKAVHCTDCHSMEPTRLDFAKVGYPPARIESLTRPAVFRMIQNIASGQKFYLPEFIAPDQSRSGDGASQDNPPPTQP